MKKIRVGLIGAGFSAQLHAHGLRNAHGVEVELTAVASARYERAQAFARRNGIPDAYGNYAELIADPEIDLVSVCVSNSAHAEIVTAALRAGKHVVCEKPLTGAFGPRTIVDPVERARDEWQRVRTSIAELRDAVASSGRQFMYAENWVYAPAMTKIERLLEHSAGTALDIRAEESHSGSHAERSRHRETAGGGALLMLGSHAIGAALHLKAAESARNGGRPATVQAVLADTATFDDVSESAAAGYLVDDWEDVERWANLVLRFSDGTRAVVNASFAMLGGTRNRLEVYTPNAAFRAEMTPNNSLMAFTPDGAAFGDEYLHEKVEARTGWIHAAPDEDWERGYPQEMQDFVEAAADDRPARAGFELAAAVADTTYAAYVSAASGCRIDVS